MALVAGDAGESLNAKWVDLIETAPGRKMPLLT
jgi:hypothetical protein